MTMYSFKRKEIKQLYHSTSQWKLSRLWHHFFCSRLSNVRMGFSE